MGYNLAKGFSRAGHDQWIREVHLPDMNKVPGLEKIILNRTERVVVGHDLPEYVAELHYPDMDAYLAGRSWIRRHPFPRDSRPEGKIIIRYMLVCQSRDLKDRRF